MGVCLEKVVRISYHLWMNEKIDWLTILRNFYKVIISEEYTDKSLRIIWISYAAISTCLLYIIM